MTNNANQISTRKDLDPRKTKEKKLGTYRIPARKSLDPRNTRKKCKNTEHPREKLSNPRNTHKKHIPTHEISTWKTFRPTKYPRKKISDPQINHEKKFWTHNSTMTWKSRNLAHSLISTFSRAGKIKILLLVKSSRLSACKFLYKFIISSEKMAFVIAKTDSRNLSVIFCVINWFSLNFSILDILVNFTKLLY